MKHGISEVKLNYYIAISYESNLPLTYEIYDITNETENKLYTNNDKTELITFGLESIEEHKYKITFTWSLENNEAALYAGKKNLFYIDVYAEQKMD